MFQITIPFLYLLAAAAFATSRLRPNSPRAGLTQLGAFVFATAAVVMHGMALVDSLTQGGTINVSLLASISLIGLQLAIIGTLAAID